MICQDIEWAKEQMMNGAVIFRTSARNRHIQFKRHSDGAPFFYVVDGWDAFKWIPSTEDLEATDYMTLLCQE
jgi:hypothetical protein